MEQIEGYEGLYEIHLNGPDGQPGVWSGYKRNHTVAGFLKPRQMKNGYLKVELSNVERKTHCIHQIVANHFINKPVCDCCDSDKFVVDHINQNKTNNCVQNLRWVPQWINNYNCDTKHGVKKVRSGRFASKVRYNGKEIWLGTYDTFEEARTVSCKFKKERMDEWLEKHYGL